MATTESANQKLDDLIATLDAHDAKLDEVKAFILAIVKPIVTQEQFDAIEAKIDSAKSKADAVLAETDALDEPTPA